MINTIIYRRNNHLCLHSVGLAECLEIIDTEIEPNTYLYEVVYRNKISTRVKNVILATDLRLT
jgi:hypothetical protein